MYVLFMRMPHFNNQHQYLTSVLSVDRAQETNLLEKVLLFFNQGNDSTADEQGAAAAGAIALDDKFSGEPYQVSTFSLA